MTDDQLAEFIAILRTGGVLDDVIECVRRTRRTLGLWTLMRQDFEESQRRGLGGCARYEVHQDGQGLAGGFKGLGVERDGKVGRRSP